MTRRRERRVRATRFRIRIVLATFVASLLALASFAEEPAKTSGSVAAASPVLIPARPYWPELTGAQRDALKPLVDDWEHLDFQTKKKWVEIANRYPKMSPEEQGRTHDRMREWAMLTPDQRRVARDSFARIRAMAPEQRAEMLRKYQELPPEKKLALATEGRAAKPLVVPKPMTTAPLPVPRRTQIREGAKDHNPAVAARKSASPIMTPATPKPTTPAATTPVVAPSTAAPTAPIAPVTGPAAPLPTPVAAPRS